MSREPWYRDDSEIAARRAARAAGDLGTALAPAVDRSVRASEFYRPAPPPAPGPAAAPSPPQTRAQRWRARLARACGDLVDAMLDAFSWRN